MKNFYIKCIRLLFLILIISNYTLAQNVLITYYSESGHTSIMAKSVAEGAHKVHGAEVRLIAAAVQEFIRTWPFDGQELKDKIGAVFVTGGGMSAGEELAQMNLIHTMMVFNMIIVGGPTWDQPFGASAVTGEEPFGSSTEEASIDPIFLKKASALGERVANLARRFRD
jgi:NAD(P)H dehydrogenase (quinone)